MVPVEARPALHQLTLHIIRESAPTIMTPRKREVCMTFGIPPREAPPIIADGLTLTLHPGSITLINGPSGSGKSSTLQYISQEIRESIWVSQTRFPNDRPMIDAIAPKRRLPFATELLTACGLGEPRIWIRRFGELSEGEKLRAALARAFGTALAGGGDHPILCDEFAATLHEDIARTISHNLRRLVTRHELILIVAGTRNEYVEHLQPDRVIQLGGDAPRLLERGGDASNTARLRHATIEQGTIREYQAFSQMHYRNRDGLGFVDQVLTLRDRPGGEKIGIAVLAHAPRELALRNAATRGRFVRNIKRLNRELRILRRLVIHPDFRGCGVGHWFVRGVLTKAKVRFVECMAVMGAVNPVFEKAGMTRIGQCPLPRGRLALLDRMLALKLDPLSPDFERQLIRNPRVRALVERTLVDWLSRMQSASPWRVENRTADELTNTFRQIISRPPIYYLWDREGEFPPQGFTVTCENRPDDEKRDPPSRVDSSDRHNPHTVEKCKDSREGKSRDPEKK